VLTFACAGVLHASRLRALAGAVLALPLIILASVHPAQAKGIRLDSCVGSWHASGCATIWAPLEDPNIRKVPQPGNDAERARAIEQDRRWVARCRPTLRQDRYGVPRYQYARPGCEFGVGEF
jgi:hypothetical protein